MPDAPAATPDAPSTNPFKRLAGATGATPKRSHHAKPKATPLPKRNSLAEGFGMLWGVGGGAISMRGNPAGRVMRVQAPMAGREFDRWVKKHPVIDSVFQPLLGADGLDFVSKVLLPPLAVHVAWSRPELVPLIQPVLMPMLYKLFLEVRREEAKMADALEAITADEVDGSAEFEAFLAALGLAGDDGSEPEPEYEGPTEEPGEGAEVDQPEYSGNGAGDVSVEAIIGPPSVGVNPAVS